MPDTLHARAKSIFLEAIEQEASAREAFLDRACAGEVELRREVQALLEHHDPQSVVGERARVPGRTDVYAAGAVAYQLLGGQPLFPGAEDIQLLHHIVNTDPKPLSELAPRPLPPELVSLVTSCLAKDPTARPQSAREFGGRLSSLSGVPPWTQQDAAGWWQANPGPA